jgi:hypothetical protein
VATARCEQAGRERVADGINLFTGIAASTLYLAAVAVVLLGAGTYEGGTM